MSTDEKRPGTSPASAQLRREAEKARGWAAGAYTEDNRQRFNAIAATLDREADEIERALVERLEKDRDRLPSWLVAPPFRNG